MPIIKTKNGFKWGKHGKVYKSRKKALKQMKTIFASGHKEK